MADFTDARLELCVHAQDMILNPAIDGLVQFGKHLKPEAFLLRAKFEASKQIFKILVRLEIFLVGGTTIAFHALLLVAEMIVHVALQKIQKPDNRSQMFRRGIGLDQQRLKMIQVANQLTMLFINGRRPGGKLFGPQQHGQFRFNFWNHNARTPQPASNRFLLQARQDLPRPSTTCLGNIKRVNHRTPRIFGCRAATCNGRSHT